MGVKKAPIMSIVGEKSPVIRSLLPSTKEQSLWLFDKLDTETLKRKEHDTDEEESHPRVTSFNRHYLGEEKLGIIGESLNKFNSISLIPVDKGKDQGQDQGNETNQEKTTELEHNQTEH